MIAIHNFLFLHKSSVNFNLDPMVEVLVLASFSILTLDAFTLLGTFDPTTVAVTVVLSAFAFLASASFERRPCWYAFKGTWVSIVGYFLCLIDL